MTYHSMKSKTFDGNFDRSVQRNPTRMEDIKEETEQQISREDKLECQSDIVIGQHFTLREGEQILYDEDDERKTNSDIHEMFFVNELLKDDEKFNNLLLQKKKISTRSESLTYEDLGSDSESDEEEVLTMNRVRFSSLCNIPSQMECCFLDY